MLKTLEHLLCKALIASLCLGGNLAFGKDFSKQDRANSICKNVKVFFDYETQFFTNYYKADCQALGITINEGKASKAVYKLFIKDANKAEYIQVLKNCARLCDGELKCEQELFNPILTRFVASEKITSDLCKLMI